jgi:acyl-homoserine lactone acylase PvdQ
VQRRMERIRRQQEIAEAAANENKDSSEKQMRANFMVQRLWNQFMKKKMEKEMMKSQHIDEAFKAIKTSTGINDVQELVTKFLTREQTYSQLLMAVSDSERKIDTLKKENEDLRSRLHDLNIASEGQGDKVTSDEIVELEN